MTVIGVNAGQLTVENGAADLLRAWLPAYVVPAYKRYTDGRDPVADGFPFRASSVVVVPEFVPNTDQELPYVQVAAGEWRRLNGDQRGWRVQYDYGIYVVVGAEELDDVRLARACFEDAVAGLIGQRPSLLIGAEDTQVTGGGPSQTDFDPGSARTLQASVTFVQTTLAGVLDQKYAPVAPDPLPEEGGAPPDWPADPQAEFVTFTYEPEPIEGDD